MFDSILIPTDGSRAARHASDMAFEFGEQFDATVNVLTVTEASDIDADLEEVHHQELAEVSIPLGGDATEPIVARGTERGLEVTTAVRDGSAHAAILKYAAENDIGLIVMGTHGRTDTALGSTTERVVTAASSPVLAVPFPVGSDPSMADRIVIATDGSELAERAAESAFAVAETFGASVSVCYVLDTTVYQLADAPRSIIGLLESGGRRAVDSIATTGRERGLSVQIEVRRGPPADGIVDFADAVEARLIVLGSRGRGGVEDHFLGSTAARVLRRSNRPILVV